MSLAAVLIDIDGVLHVGAAPVSGAAAALQRLRDAGLRLAFLTNTTRRTRQALIESLDGMGFDIPPDEIQTAALAARAVVERRGLRPHLLIHPDLAPDWEGVRTDDANAVVIGDAGEGFTYAALNEAFRVLIRDDAVPLIAMGANRYFRATDGLSLDMGPFVAALEFAGRRQAEYTGKPAAAFFETAMAALDVPAANAVMIGDDLENDVVAAQDAGLHGILVRTGKYRPQDEQDPKLQPQTVADNFVEAVRGLLESI